MKLSIIIPCFNEEKTIKELIRRVLRAKLPKGVKKEVIVVDDGSSDQTVNILKSMRQLPLRVIRHPLNQGKGMAVRSGIKVATGEIILIQDADLEYDPQDYGNLIQPILDNKAIVVYGSRELNKRNKRHSYLTFYFGGLLISLLTNILYNSSLSDVPTGYKVFKKEVLTTLNLKCRGFEFCPEVTAKIIKQGIHIREVPIKYYPRTTEAGKKIRWTDGLKAIWTLIKYRFCN